MGVILHVIHQTPPPPRGTCQCLVSFNAIFKEHVNVMYSEAFNSPHRYLVQSTGYVSPSVHSISALSNPGGGESVFKIKLTQGEISKVKGLFNMVQYISRLNSVHKRNCDFFQNGF